jgi:hypothetical protein
MLTEIALTPHTFQPCSVDPDSWADQIHLLNHRLLHYGSQCPLIFSDLNQKSIHRTPGWRAEVGRLIAGIRGRHRQILADLFTRLQDYLVSRPSLGHVRVATEEPHWVREAVGPAPHFPIDQIVVTHAGLGDAQRVHTPCISVNRLDQEPFWGSIAFSAFPPMAISDQVEPLRPLWLHGQVLALVLPYALETGRTGEADWFFEFASLAFSRPADHGEPIIELHVSFDGNGADMKARGAAHPLVSTFIQEAQRQAGLRGHEFNLVVRARSHFNKRFIARRLFAGEEVNVGTRVPDVRVRWGIALEHVALRADSPQQTQPTFTLLPRHQADAQFRSECRDVGPQLVPPTTIRC